MGIFSGQIKKTNIKKNYVKTKVSQTKLSARKYISFLSLEDEKYVIERNIKKSKKNKYNKHVFLEFIDYNEEKNETNSNPVIYDGVIFYNSGQIVDGTQDKLTNNYNFLKKFSHKYKESEDLEKSFYETIDGVKGSISAALVIPHIGKLLLYSNTKSLYVHEDENLISFSTDYNFLNYHSKNKIIILDNKTLIFDIPKVYHIDEVSHIKKETQRINRTIYNTREKDILKYDIHELKRCTKCILPETFPYIKYDDNGVCNYCNNHKKHVTKGKKEDFIEIMKKYKQEYGNDCIVPFSGGRDSCYVLNLIVNELKMNPITYTYDWGMMTDLASRNISIISQKLNVPNITIGADFTKKRKNIKKNFSAWLKKPDLGMLNILTAGDKHFFKYIIDVKKMTGLKANLWGTNYLETTFFKAGFLGLKPSFEDNKVYTTGFSKQLKYQMLRLKKMFINPRYFNRSIIDTLSGEYYRSFSKKEDYYHLFDYYTWDESEVERTIFSLGFEKAIDTDSTWRIGDGTAGIYNYIYYHFVGFTENDTFRSNQIREGLITREMALKIVEVENEPRYENIRWYLDSIGMNFTKTIKKINAMKPLFRR